MISPDSLLFGTAGIPISSKGTTVDGISKVKELGLGCMELEFVHSVNITKEKAPEIKRTKEKENIFLTCHAPYFINLNSSEPAKKYASMQRIEKSAEILHECGGWSVCFHPGFYMKEDPSKVYDTIKDRIKEIVARLQDKSIDVWIRPETTGKASQFGSFDELLRISEELENVMPVFDFSHIHARTQKYNTIQEFTEVLTQTEKHLGKEGLENMHIHLSGINYSDKGERNHLILEESDMNYKDLLTVWKEFKIKGCVICESPNIEEDALLLKKTYER
ncbi:MAG: TIM barrel protein [archaeon]